MEISAIVPVYNEEKNIGGCLESLLKQTVVPEEIIVVDNNCTDKTIAIAKTFPRVRIVKEGCQGMASAREAGFAAAKNELLLRTDADTRLFPGWAEKALEKINSDKGVVAVSGPVVFLEKKARFASEFLGPFFAFLCQALLKQDPLFGPGMLVKKSVWEKSTPCKKNNIHEDLDLTIHLSRYGKTVLVWDLPIHTSARRPLSNPKSFFIDYPVMLLKTYLHKKDLEKKGTTTPPESGSA